MSDRAMAVLIGVIAGVVGSLFVDSIGGDDTARLIGGVGASVCVAIGTIFGSRL